MQAEPQESPDSQGRITQAIERLEELAQAMDSSTTRLGKRLEPVLVESPAVPGDTMLEAARLVTSPFAERLDGLADRFRNHIARIDGYSERLDA